MNLDKKEIGRRVAFTIMRPNSPEELRIEPVYETKGLGHWIYCKYCYENVLPVLGGINQVVCSKCGYGLSPDFFTFKALKEWVNPKADTDFDQLMKEDEQSDEAKRWKAKWKGQMP